MQRNSQPWVAHTINILLWIVIVAIGVGLRYLNLSQPIRYDEAFTYNNFASVNLPTVLSDYTQPNNHIFYTLLVHLLMRALGGAIWVIRLPAFLAGIALIWVQYGVTRRFFGHAAGMLAAALVSISLSMIEFSVNGRGYTLLALFTALLIWQGKHLQDNPADSGWWWYGVICALGLYTIPVMLYAVGGVSLWMVLSLWQQSPKDRRIVHIVRLFLALAFGAVLTILLYTPVFL